LPSRFAQPKKVGERWLKAVAAYQYLPCQVRVNGVIGVNHGLSS